MTTAMEPYEHGATPATTVGALVPKTMTEALEVAKMLHASGWFKDITDPGKALTKIMLGQEMGVSPMTAVRGIYVISTTRGPVITLAGDLVAKLMRAHGYDWTIDQLDAQGCRLTIRSGSRILGQVEFTEAMARKAKLLGKEGPWSQYAEDMYFNRAIARAQRRYAPEVTGGLPMPVMDAEELDSQYPDPKDDLMKRLQATYRERFPKQPEMSADEDRTWRLLWSEQVLQRRGITTWNGPEAPETLTRADVQLLIDTLESTPAPLPGQAAPVSPGTSTAGADHTQDSEGRGEEAERDVPAGREAPSPSDTPKRSRTAKVSGVLPPAIADAQAFRDERKEIQRGPTTWLQTLPVAERTRVLACFRGSAPKARDFVATIASQERLPPLSEWSAETEWTAEKLAVLMVAAEAEVQS